MDPYSLLALYLFLSLPYFISWLSGLVSPHLPRFLSLLFSRSTWASLLTENTAPTANASSSISTARGHPGEQIPYSAHVPIVVACLMGPAASSSSHITLDDSQINQ
ncbi:hypothetical protein C8J56DRAFT_948191 [Mycena floridula]|nr:hypothetical protein C8J56DRAFT_948191 [Mycena floridula]